MCACVCAFVPVIFLLDSCMFYVSMFYGPSWSDSNKYLHTYIHTNLHSLDVVIKEKLA